jgi:hypothetical protein
LTNNSNQSSYDRSKLSYRRQFILGPRFVEHIATPSGPVEPLAGWQRVAIRPTVCLTVHPDLAVCQVRDGQRSITLLGFILDPTEPQASDREIVGSLLRALTRTASVDRFVAGTDGFGGRWVLIVDDGRDLRLFHDAAGLRQVFYTRRARAGTIWCASDAGVIARILGLSIDPKAEAFMNSWTSRQYWWPGDTSPYTDVRRLLPNHYLDLGTAETERYWPNSNLGTVSLPECTGRVSTSLVGMLRAARNRFPLALTITAGWDSRVALAATRNIDDVFCFTLQYWDHTAASDDIRVPARLLPRLGLTHHVFRCPSTMNDAFAEIYRNNVTTAHDVYGIIAEALYASFPGDHVMVKGVVSEVTRCWYQQRVPHATNQTLTPAMLAHAVEMDHPFALAALDGWLQGTNRALNVDILDLLFWEQRIGSWQSTAQLEWDIVQDVLTPFNCRALLIDLLSLDTKHRASHSPAIYIELMKTLWPEVLDEPINPSKDRVDMRAVLQRLVAESGVRRFVPSPLRKLGGRLLYRQSRF